MRNITIQLIKRKICIEADPNFNGASTRILAYASLELDEGLVIDEISIRQDIDNRSDIRVIFPFRKVHDEIIPYISFTSEEAKKEIIKNILTKVSKSVENDLFSDDIGSTVTISR